MASDSDLYDEQPKEVVPWAKIILHGIELIRNPKYNKGMAFTKEERVALRLEGLLPAKVLTQDEQVQRTLKGVRKEPSDLARYIFLLALVNRNERLFYRLLIEHVEEMMPLVYTPTVGLACQEFGHIFRTPRGLYISLEHRGRVSQVLNNWPEDHVRAIVFTDGERILGLGDLGTYGMGIPIGKLMLYTACGGVDPTLCLPVQIDVGTNNEKLLEASNYTGLRRKREKGDAYDELIDEFITAAQMRFGSDVLLQFEDFGNANAFRLLDKYQDRGCIFNDDIQGTAAVVLGGLYASLKAIKMHALPNESENKGKDQEKKDDKDSEGKDKEQGKAQDTKDSKEKPEKDKEAKGTDPKGSQQKGKEKASNKKPEQKEQQKGKEKASDAKKPEQKEEQQKGKEKASDDKKPEQKEEQKKGKKKASDNKKPEQKEEGDKKKTNKDKEGDEKKVSSDHEDLDDKRKKKEEKEGRGDAQKQKKERTVDDEREDDENAETLGQSRILFFGAGSAGCGIANLIAYAIAQEERVSQQQARKNIFLVDSKGLIYKGRPSGGMNGEKEPFAHDLGEEINHDKLGGALEDIIAFIKPTALIGVSSIPNSFNKACCEEMAKISPNPLIFALSNPTSKSECTAEDAYTWTDGKCLFASGSPFPPFQWNGRTLYPGQGNNSFIFPGLALGVITIRAKRVTDRMFYVAAKTLASCVTREDIMRGSLYPPQRLIRDVSLRIAVAVAEVALDDGLTALTRPRDLYSTMKNAMYTGVYPKFI